MRLDDGTEDFDERCRMTDSCDCAECQWDREDGYDDDPDGCIRCGGDGWVTCDDPEQCTLPHDELGDCECPACGGTGNMERAA